MLGKAALPCNFPVIPLLFLLPLCYPHPPVTPTLQPHPLTDMVQGRSHSPPSPQLSLLSLWEAQPPSMVWRQGGGRVRV